MMMAANLIGFVIGTDGMKYVLHQVFDNWQGAFMFLVCRGSLLFQRRSPVGIRFLLFACACIFVAVQVMFEYRYVLSPPVFDSAI